MPICPSCQLEYTTRSYSNLCPACDSGASPRAVRAEHERDEVRTQMIALISSDKHPPCLPWVLHKRPIVHKIDLWSAEKFDGYTIADLTNAGARIMARDLAPVLADWLVDNGLARWASETKPMCIHTIGPHTCELELAHEGKHISPSKFEWNTDDMYIAVGDHEEARPPP